MRIKKIYYNKLIRDKIPEQIAASGSGFRVKKLSPRDFERELRKKVSEEARGVINAKTRQELISELADVTAVLDEIVKLKKISARELTIAKQKNFKRKGGFTKKLFLEWSSDDGYKSNEQ